MNWIKKYSNLLLVICGIIVALIIAEIGLRLFVPTERVMSDPILGYIGNPRSGFYDSSGFRNDKVLENAEVVAIGDSQTEGNNAPVPSEAWPQVLGKLAGKSVYQLAVGGDGPIQYSYLMDKAIKLNPNLIIIGFYTGNDLMDTYYTAYSNDYWASLRDPEFKYEEKEEDTSIRLLLQNGSDADSAHISILQFRLWLRSKSALYTFLGRATRGIREALGLAETGEERNARIEKWLDGRPELGFVYKEESIKTLLSPSYRKDSVNLSDPRTSEGWRITEKQFREMADKARINNIEFVIAVIPTKEMVYGAYILGNNYGISKALNEYVGMETDLKNKLFLLCKGLRIQCVDVLPGLVAKLNDKVAIYPQELDGHPIPEGYRAIAETLYKSLWGSNK